MGFNWHENCNVKPDMTTGGSMSSPKYHMKKVLDKLRNQWISPIIDKVIENTPPPEDGSISREDWIKKTRAELYTFLSDKEGSEKFELGMNAIIEDLEKNLGKEEVDRISKEWKAGVEKWFSKMSPHNGNEEEQKTVTLQELMEISEQTLEEFYDAATRYYKNRDFQRASAAFYVVNCMDYRRHNVWISIGLCEMHDHNWDKAIFSFGMASLTDMTSPYPYLYSANCCCQNKHFSEATVYLNLAEKAIREGNWPDKATLENTMLDLRLKCQKNRE
jgi:hypothetical protein